LLAANNAASLLFIATGESPFLQQQPSSKPHTFAANVTSMPKEQP